MTALVTQRVHRLADSLTELKVKVRAALATELAGAVGVAVRDVLVAALIERVLAAPARTPIPPRADGWREDEYGERDRWGEPRDPWNDVEGSDVRDRMPARYERDEMESAPATPTAGSLAVGLNVGRWWLARRGSVPAAIGFGVLAAVLGLAGGPTARAALAILAAATDLLTAESALARSDPF